MIFVADSCSARIAVVASVFPAVTIGCLLRARMLVRDRGWTAQQYEEWLGDTLVEALVRKDAPRAG